MPAVKDGARTLSVGDGNHVLREMTPLLFDVGSGDAQVLDVGMPVFPGMRWTGDGRIVFEGGDGGIVDQVFVVNADGTGLTPLNMNGSGGIAGDNGNVMLPDGNSMVVASHAGENELWTLALDGTKHVTVIVPARRGVDDAFLGVSPDGTAVAYVYESTCCNDLHVVSTDGSGDRELMKNVYVPSPVWSPDGTRMVVKQNGSFTVLTVDGSTGPVPLPHSTDLGVASWQTVMR